MRNLVTGGLALASVCFAACSASGGDGDPSLEEMVSGADGGEEIVPSADNPSGLPFCGEDPTAQPDRCIDAQGAERCRVETGFPGDELALCDMDPEEGMLIHFGPQDYSDPDDVQNFILEPSGEEEFCMYLNTPNDTERWFNQYHGRLRPNSHHLIVTMPAEHHEADTAPWTCGPQVIDRWLFGSQDPQIDVDTAKDTQPGDPDYGVVHDVPPQQTLLLDFHNVNPTTEPALREAWAVLKYVDEAEALVKSDLIGFYNPNISLPPLAQGATPVGTCTPPTDLAGVEQPVYLGVATVHAHERLVRGSLWHNKADGTSELIYQSRNWSEPGNAAFTRGQDNPELPLAPGQDWGAKDGYVQILPGESLSFQCEYQNNLDQVVTFGETTQQEMCNIFGFYYPSVGGMWNCFAF